MHGFNSKKYTSKIGSPSLLFLPATLSASILVLCNTAKAQAPVYPIPVVDKSSAIMEALNIPADAYEKGMFSPLIDWPIISIHSNALPDGRILTFGAAPGTNIQDGRVLVFWDPALGFEADSRIQASNAQDVDSFCASAVLMADGNLLTSGGNSYSSPGSSRESTLIDYRTSDSIKDSDLNSPRWYGTMTRLVDGRAIITGGGVPYAGADPDLPPTTPAHSSTPEIYTPGQGWQTLTGAFSTDAFGATSARWWYPRQWVTPAGSVFGISTEKMWEMDVSGTGSILTIGDFKTRSNEVTRPNTGPTSTAVMFDTGMILQVGGNGYSNSYQSSSSNQATIFDINRLDEGVLDISETNPMIHARQWGNSTVLPNGEVFVSGGSRYADTAGDNTVLESEIWNPSTGLWRETAASAVFRGYHSSTALMQAGTVFTAGSGAPGPRIGLDAEVFYPPYLFQQDASGSVLADRPRIISISDDTLGYGDTIDIQIGDGVVVSSVSVIGLSSTTHSFDSNQRFLKLDFTNTANGVQALIPSNGNLMPPGYYHLHIVDDSGVPSVSAIIAVNSDAPEAITPPIPLNFLATSDDQWQNFSLITDGDTNTYNGDALIDASEAWINFSLGGNYNKLSFSLTEDNAGNYETSQWKVQAWSVASNGFVDIMPFQNAGIRGTQVFTAPADTATTALRLLLRADNGIGLSEFSVKGSKVAGRAIIATTVASDSGDWLASNPATNSIDLVLDYQAQSNSSESWIAYDLGGNFDQLEFRLREDNGGSNNVVDWWVQRWDASSNSWLDITPVLAANAGGGYGDVNTYVPPPSVAATNLRLFMRNAGGTVGVSEFEIIGVRKAESSSSLLSAE